MTTTLENKSLQKCLSDLKSIGISFELDQEETDVYGVYGDFRGKRKLENVVFRKGNQVMKISNWIFFRNGGICTILETKKSNKKGEENFVKLHQIIDEEFYEMQHQMIEFIFTPKKEEK